MYNQLSGEVSVAWAIRKAISGLSADFELINADKVLRVTPKRLAASVMVSPSGLITLSQHLAGMLDRVAAHSRFSPLPLMIITIVNVYRIISLKLKCYAPIAISQTDHVPFSFPFSACNL